MRLLVFGSIRSIAKRCLYIVAFQKTSLFPAVFFLCILIAFNAVYAALYGIHLYVKILPLKCEN